MNLEDAFLASLLAHPDALYEVSLPREAFASAQARALWERILDLRTRGQPLDPLLLAVDFPRPEYLHHLARQAITGEVKTLADRLWSQYQMRRLQALLRRALQATQTGSDVHEVLGVLAPAFHGATLDGPVRVDGALQALAGRTSPRRYGTGLPALDELLGGGLRRQTLTLVGARPSVGKTALMLSLAVHLARSGTPTLLVEVEQSTEEDAERLTAILGGLPLGEVQRDRSLARTVQADLPLYLWEGARTVEDAVGMVHRMAVQGVEVVFLDYLQLLTPRDRALRNPVEQVTYISRTLKAAAKTADVALVALSQLSRESERREDRQPRLSDLRDSGSLEQDADVVLLLSRDPEEPYALHIAVAKNRHGPTGELTAYFHLPTQRVLPAHLPPLEETP